LIFFEEWSVMRSLRVSLYSLFAVACFGCPGTIDDPAAYEAFQGTGKVPEVIDDVDAGDTVQPVDETDASAQAEADAWTAKPGDMNPSAGDAAAGDGAANPLADAGGAAEAGTGTGCNFKALMQMRCAGAACHGSPSPSTGLDLVSDDLAVRLSGRRGTDGCEDYLMIDTAQPNQSALYLKVTGNACGVRMPIGGSLSAAEQACILQWIDNL
jgi:hypothetical protein